MNCPNCQAKKLLTIETYQTPDETIRTKKCSACSWRFTSHETIAEDMIIPDAVRQTKRKRIPEPLTSN